MTCEQTTRVPIACAALLLCSSPTLSAAQLSDVSPFDKHAWGENIGWLNWRDAGDPVATQGVRVNGTYLSGFIWGENIGWITVGDGSPTDGINYTNSTGLDSGVNHDPITGDLKGMAWGENVGWINFGGGSMATPARPARISLAAPRRFHGYAWGENIGWINLNDAVHFVALNCPADYNGDGFVDGIDSDDFNNDFEAGGPAADYNRDGFVDGIDYDQFNNDFEAGC